MASSTRSTDVSSELDAPFEEIVIGAAPDPRPFYAELRERAPVYRTPFDFWYVTRYDLANRSCARTATGASPRRSFIIRGLESLPLTLHD